MCGKMHRVPLWCGHRGAKPPFPLRAEDTVFFLRKYTFHPIDIFIRIVLNIRIRVTS